MSEERTYTFGEPIENIIQRRKSVRTYSRLPIETEVKEKIQKHIDQQNGPFQVAFRLEMIDKLKIREDEKIKLGTYGIIQGVNHFVAAAVEKKEHNMEQLGYVLENLILYITSLGLGTCWLGGTFNKGRFSKVMQIKESELLPIVTPVGYESRIKSPIDLIMKPKPNLKIRKSWDVLFFNENATSVLDKADAGDYATPLEMVRLAPSASNKQPWRIVFINKQYHFYLAHDIGYSSVFPYDIQKIDIGIAMCHFECMAKESGLKGKWEITSPALNNAPKGWEYIVTWIPL